MTSRTRQQPVLRWLLALVGTLPAVLVCSVPTDAEACSFAPVLTPAAPRDGETDVALNAQILLKESIRKFESTDGGVFTLEQILGDGGTSDIGFTVESLGALGRLHFFRHVLTPTGPLEANSTYRLSASFAPASEFSFTTGTMLDTTAPPVPEAPVQEIVPYVPPPSSACADDRLYDSCSSYGVGGTKLHFAAQPDVVAWDILTPDGGVIAPRIGSGQMAWYQCHEDWTSGVQTTEWRPPEDGEILIRAVDVAGNVSEPRPLTLQRDCQPLLVCSEPDGGVSDARPEDAVNPLPDTGCGSAPFLLLPGVALLGALLRRRRVRPE